MTAPASREPRFTPAPRFYWLLALFVLLFQLPFLSGLDNANANTRVMLTAAIVDHGTTRIDPYQGATGDKSVFDGHYYSDKAPGMALLAIPAYALAQAVFGTPDDFTPLDDTSVPRQLVFRLMVLSTSGLAVALAAVAFFRMALAVTGQPQSSLLATLTVFLGTPMLGWSVYFFGHAAAGACLIFAFAQIFHIAPDRDTSGNRSRRAILAGLALGLAVSIEYTAAPAVALIGLYGLFRVAAFARTEALRLLGLAILSCGLAVVPMMIYHTVSFGGPFSVGYSNVVGFEGMEEGFLGLTAPDPAVLYQILFGVRRGLIWLAPVVVLAPVAFWMALKRGVLVPEMLISGLVILYYLLLNASYHYWDGGASVGPRHITPALPFIGVILLYLWGRQSGTLRRLLLAASACGVAISVICASSTMTAPGGYMYPLWNPVLTGLIDTGGIWAFYAKAGLPPILAVALWLLFTGGVFARLWRQLSRFHR